MPQTGASLNRIGTRAESTALTLNAKQAGTLFYVTDEGVMERWSGSAWVQVGTDTPAQDLGDSSWTAPTLLNSWVNYGGAWDTAGYRKDGQGVVYLKGLVKSGTTSANLFVLPSGYRPASQLLMHGRGTTGEFRIDIFPSGVVYFNSADAAFSSISGISFYADGS